MAPRVMAEGTEITSGRMKCSRMSGIHFGFSLLLVCMMTGTLFCNICDFSEELMSRIDRWTAPLNVLFFVLSGAELDLGVLSQAAG